MEAEIVDRAARFVLNLPMRYRRKGEDDWTTGKTVNVSRSGVLFAADENPLPGTALEMWLEMSGENPACAAIFCTGMVVRHDDEQRVAARFQEYQLVAQNNLPQA